MGMLEIFYPDETADTSYGIDYEALYRKGYRGLIYDVDNTLVPHGAPADDRAKALFERLHTIGFSAVLLSNNKEPRVKSFAEDVKYADYIFKADKPSVKGYEEAMRRMGTTKETTLFIGDQLFTDVWGAKEAESAVFWSNRSIPKRKSRSFLKDSWKKLCYTFIIGRKAGKKCSKGTETGWTKRIQ